jgi:hypothetical protein
MQACLFAACGPDEVPNHVLHLLLPHLLAHLVTLYRASLALAHVLWSRHNDVCVVLCKPKEAGLSRPEGVPADCLRALCWEWKGLRRVIVTWLARLAESHGMLPMSQLGGQRRRLAEDAVVCVVDKIKGQ